LNQTLQGLGRPFAAGSLAGFWGIDARQTDGDLVACLVSDPNCVAIPNGYEDDSTKDQRNGRLGGRGVAVVAVALSCLGIGVATTGIKATAV